MVDVAVVGQLVRGEGAAAKVEVHGGVDADVVGGADGGVGAQSKVFVKERREDEEGGGVGDVEFAGGDVDVAQAGDEAGVESAAVDVDCVEN